MAERMFAKNGHATLRDDKWIVYLHVDKVRGLSQPISDPVSKTVAQKMLNEIDGSKSK